MRLDIYGGRELGVHGKTRRQGQRGLLGGGGFLTWDGVLLGYGGGR